MSQSNIFSMPVTARRQTGHGARRRTSARPHAAQAHLCPQGTHAAVRRASKHTAHASRGARPPPPAPRVPPPARAISCTHTQITSRTSTQCVHRGAHPSCTLHISGSGSRVAGQRLRARGASPPMRHCHSAHPYIHARRRSRRCEPRRRLRGSRFLRATARECSTIARADPSRSTSDSAALHLGGHHSGVARPRYCGKPSGGGSVRLHRRGRRLR